MPPTFASNFRNFRLGRGPRWQICDVKFLRARPNCASCVTKKCDLRGWLDVLPRRLPPHGTRPAQAGSIGDRSWPSCQKSSGLPTSEKSTH